MLEIQITGMDKFIKLLTPLNFEREIDKGIQEASQALADAAKRMPPVSAKSTGYGTPGIPVDTGYMRQRINRRKLQLLAAEVYADTNYSLFVEQGTGGMPPRPFLWWAYDLFGGRQQVEQIMHQALGRALRK